MLVMLVIVVNRQYSTISNYDLKIRCCNRILPTSHTCTITTMAAFTSGPMMEKEHATGEPELRGSIQALEYTIVGCEHDAFSGIRYPKKLTAALTELDVLTRDEHIDARMMVGKIVSTIIRNVQIKNLTPTAALEAINMALYGPSDVHMTAVATVLAKIIHAGGYLPDTSANAPVCDGDVVNIVEAGDLVLDNVIDSCAGALQLLRQSIGKVLYIDKVHQLTSGIGMEILSVITMFLTQHPSDVVVILGGQQEHIEHSIFKGLPALARRLGWRFNCGK